MIRAGSLEFALARLHARLARRPPAAAWRGIARSRETIPVLDLIRGTTLAPLAAPLAAAPDLHALDRVARDSWRAMLDETRRWMPPEWDRAIAWCGSLACVPALAHLALAGRAPAWMATDPDLAPVARVSPEERAAAIAAGPLAPFAPAWPEPGRLPGAWLAEWRRRVPRGEMAGTPLAELTALVAAHLAALADPGALARGDEAFDEALTRRLRRHPLEPAAVFAWLALGALDIRRLRGEMARRIALPLARPVS